MVQTCPGFFFRHKHSYWCLANGHRVETILNMTMLDYGLRLMNKIPVSLLCSQRTSELKCSFLQILEVPTVSESKTQWKALLTLDSPLRNSCCRCFPYFKHVPSVHGSWTQPGKDFFAAYFVTWNVFNWFTLPSWSHMKTDSSKQRIMLKRSAGKQRLIFSFAKRPWSFQRFW